MNSNLARVLLSRDVIRRGTVIEAYQSVRGLSCECNSSVIAQFVVIGAKLINQSRVIFDTIGPEQVPYQVRAEQIVIIDGMAINRIAITQNLTLEGVEVPVRSRRGRRRKLPTTESHATL